MYERKLELLTKLYGSGAVYLNKKPIGRPGVALDESLSQLEKEKNGEIVVIFAPEGGTYAGVGITLTNGSALVDMDFAQRDKKNYLIAAATGQFIVVTPDRPSQCPAHRCEASDIR